MIRWNCLQSLPLELRRKVVVGDGMAWIEPSSLVVLVRLHLVDWKRVFQVLEEIHSFEAVVSQAAQPRLVWQEFENLRWMAVLTASWTLGRVGDLVAL